MGQTTGRPQKLLAHQTPYSFTWFFRSHLHWEVPPRVSAGLARSVASVDAPCFGVSSPAVRRSDRSVPRQERIEREGTREGPGIRLSLAELGHPSPRGQTVRGARIERVER